MFIPNVYSVRFAGIAQIIFMFGIYISGNLSFLNVLTMIPSLACLDDGFFKLFQKRKVYQKLDKKEPSHQHIGTFQSYLYSNLPSSIFQKVTDLLVFSLITYLSLPVISNLFSRTQIMNTSFDTFKLVNTYGAFGSVTKERYEIIIYGTNSTKLDGNEKWEEYEFKCKPGDVNQIPCQVAPYHYRLDWLMWFAAFGNQSWRSHTWFLNLVLKMLKNDKELLNGLLRTVPEGEIKFIKAKRFLYNFGDKNWWKREEAVWEDLYLPIMSLKDLEGFLGQYDMFKHWLR